jgi:hypothetical protein
MVFVWEALLYIQDISVAQNNICPGFTQFHSKIWGTNGRDIDSN